MPIWVWYALKMFHFFKEVNLTQDGIQWVGMSLWVPFLYHTGPVHVFGWTTNQQDVQKESLFLLIAHNQAHWEKYGGDGGLDRREKAPLGFWCLRGSSTHLCLATALQTPLPSFNIIQLVQHVNKVANDTYDITFHIWACPSCCGRWGMSKSRAGGVSAVAG